MNIKITPRFSMKLEIDGQHIDGEFTVESAWNGLVRLTSNGPCRSVNIKHPTISHLNIYDSLPKIMGGNAANDAELRTIEAEAVTRDFETPAESHARYRKQQAEAAKKSA
jgi:hypothetical protein